MTATAVGGDYERKVAFISGASRGIGAGMAESFAKAGLREVKKVRRSGQDFILMEISGSEWEQSRLSQRQRGDEDDTGKPRSEAEPTAGQTPQP